MIEEIKNGKITLEALADMKQEALRERYGAKSRSTVVEARENVLEKLRQNSDNTRTNDN